MDSGFLGISIGSPYYSRSRIDAYLAWSELNFSKFAFLLGDHIFAFTNAVFQDIPIDEAQERAISKGQDIKVMLERAAARRSRTTKIFCWDDLQRMPSYSTLLDTLLSEYHTNFLFKQTVRSQVWTNLGSRLAVTGCFRDSTIENEQSTLLDQYVLHEVAGLITISEHTEYNIEIYPGEDLEIISDCYSGKFSAIRELIPQNPRRKFMSLHLND